MNLSETVKPSDPFNFVLFIVHYNKGHPINWSIANHQVTKLSPYFLLYLPSNCGLTNFHDDCFSLFSSFSPFAPHPLTTNWNISTISRVTNALFSFFLVWIPIIGVFTIYNPKKYPTRNGFEDFELIYFLLVNGNTGLGVTNMK